MTGQQEQQLAELVNQYVKEVNDIQKRLKEELTHQAGFLEFIGSQKNQNYSYAYVSTEELESRYLLIKNLHIDYIVATASMVKTALAITSGESRQSLIEGNESQITLIVTIKPINILNSNPKLYIQL